MRVPIIDLKAQYQTIKAEIDAAVAEVFAQQVFRGGYFVETFEEELAAYCQTRHAIGVSSGTDALFLALKALPLEPGDEVITTPFSFFATASAIVHAGGIPVFADIHPETFAIDPDAIEQQITPKTKCIIPVHLFGQCAPMDRIASIAAKHRLHIIEDAAQALGASYDHCPPGRWGIAATLSFYPTKNLGGAGEGGAILTNSDEFAERIRLLRSHGATEAYRHQIIGYNSHLHALQAAVLLVKLPNLDRWNEMRRQKAHYYTEALRPFVLVKVPTEDPRAWHVYHQYVIRIPERDKAKKVLTEKGIGCAVFYPVPLHRQPCFHTYASGKPFPEAERASNEVLALPIYPELTQDQQDTVVEAICDFLNHL